MLRIIDARSGKDVRPGVWITYPPPSKYMTWVDTCADGNAMAFTGARQVENPDKGVNIPGIGLVDSASFKLLDVRDNLFSASGHFQFADGRTVWSPLRVRFTHPGFFLERVAFVPS